MPHPNRVLPSTGTGSTERRFWNLPIVHFTAFGVCGAGTVGIGVWCVAGDQGATNGEMIAGGVLSVIGVAILLFGMVMSSLCRSMNAGAEEADDLSRRLRVAADGAGIGFWDRDLRTGELRWDTTMHRIYGTEPEVDQPSSERWARMVHPADLEQTTELFTMAVNGERSFETSFRINRPDGSQRTVRTAATVIPDHQGEPMRVVGANWDVTELVETARDLTNSATRLSLAMRAARIGLWDVELTPGRDDLDTQTATCDETLHEMLGYQPGELDTPSMRWHEICHPDDLVAMRSECQAYLSGDQDSFWWDYRVRSKSGDWVWVHDAGEIVARDRHGKPTRMTGVRALIDEQKRTGDALREVTSLSNHDTEFGILTDIARSIAESFGVAFCGVARFNDETGAASADMIGGWYRGEPYPRMTYAIGGTPCEIATREDFCIYHDGVQDIFPNDRYLGDMEAVSYAGVRMFSADGKPLGVLSIIHDAPLGTGIDYCSVLKIFATRAVLEIERDEIEQSLREATAEAERASEFKSSIVANVSHEIRTPVAAMIGYADLLAETRDPNRNVIEDFTTTISRNGSHLLTMVNDLLDTSKIEAGLMRIEQIPTTLSEIIVDTNTLLGTRIQEKGLEFELRCESQVPSVVVTDPTRVRQILVNLLGNAVKFTSEGKIVLRVRYDLSSSLLSFAVIDSGIGIAPENLDSLFDPFHQAEASTSRRFGGTGLGLSISRNLARLLGGDLAVSSRLGSGSTFTATIYANSSVEAAMLEPAAFIESCSARSAGGAMVGPARPELNGVRILVVDDSVDNRRLLKFHLDRAGAAVTTADDGEQALRAIENGADPELIVSDLQMPVLDGYGLVRRIRADGLSVPVIALTAHASGDDKTKCLALGFNAYTTKPIGRDRFVAECLSAMGRGKRARAA